MGGGGDIAEAMAISPSGEYRCPEEDIWLEGVATRLGFVFQLDGLSDRRMRKRRQESTFLRKVYVAGMAEKRRESSKQSAPHRYG